MSAKDSYERWLKIYNDAPMIPCACGCGTLIKSKDKYGRNNLFVSGHNRRKYEDPKQYKREWNHRNRQQQYEYKRKRLREARSALILEKGGCCQSCGVKFDGNNDVIFDFHHRNPEEKELNLNMSSFNKISLDKLIIEARKCDLLCSNCHRLLHWRNNN